MIVHYDVVSYCSLIAALCILEHLYAFHCDVDHCLRLCANSMLIV